MPVVVNCPYCHDYFTEESFPTHKCTLNLNSGNTIPKDVVDEIIKARGGDTGPYGHFSENARVAQKIKDTLRGGRSWCTLDVDEKEALDLIALKMSRIVTGNDPHYLDNWDDLQGYPRIVADRLRQTKKE